MITGREYYGNGSHNSKKSQFAWGEDPMLGRVDTYSVPADRV